MSAETERRAHRRQPVKLKLYWEPEGASSEESATGDISTRGCSVLSGRRVEPGARVTIRAKLSTGVWVHLNGTVIHARADGFGVSFTWMSEAARRGLDELLEAHRAAGGVNDEA